MASLSDLTNSLRAYQWPSRVPRLGLLGFGAVLALQIPYPLLSENGQRQVTRWAVVAFFLTSVVHAWWSRGLRAAVALIVVCVGGGLVAELIGSKTGVPFGNYDYTNILGWRVGGVPIIVPLAWAMFGWLALLIAQHVGGGLRGAATGAALLVAWDLFLDPQMVRVGGWVWRDTVGPSLHGIPLVNSLGWFAVGLILVSALLFTVPSRRVDRFDDLGWALLGWTLFSETLLFAVFFRWPSVALVGTPALGLVLWLAWRHRSSFTRRG
jgi:uncharacterized membrane protein